MTNRSNIPVYSINTFNKGNGKSMLFQVELFDANRHFKVSYPHRHDFYEILYLNNGSGIHIIDSNEYLIKPPCIFFLSPGQAHKLDLSHDIEGYIFLFAPEFYLFDQKDKNRLLEFPFFFPIDQNNPPLYISEPENIEFIEMLFKRGCWETERDVKNSDEIVRSVLDLLLLTCNSLYPQQEVTSKSRGHILVKNFLVKIEENFHKNLNVSEYADMLAITPHHLTQVVKQYTGKTSTQFLQEKLILEIKKMLIHSNLSMSDIVDQLNFSDQSYFTKFFKKHTGVTPLDFRKHKIK